MALNEKKIVRRRIANAYLSSVISISLVLLLVGVSSLLLVNARSVTDYFKENLQLSVIMKQGVTDTQALEYKKTLDSCKFVHETEFVSKEQGEKEMAETSSRRLSTTFA